MQGIEIAAAGQGRVQHPLRAEPGQRGEAARDLQVLPRPGHRQRPVHPALGVRPGRQPAAVHHHARSSTARFLCETFDLWWPDRRKVRIRFFDNIAEALAGQKPGNCTMHETCDSYVVVEYNGDVYPCDFFVESGLEARQHHAGLLARDRAPPAALQLRRARRRWRIPSARCASTSRSATAAAPRSATARTGGSRTWTTSARPTR